MSNRPWVIQMCWLLIAAVLLAGAAVLQTIVEARRKAEDLIPPHNEIARNYPLSSAMSMSLGGLRAPVVQYLWIRSEEYKQAGRHFDAMQTAQAICRMMPRFPGVWDYHSWNLAWNISVQTHTPEERWQWVYNGVRLLRDEGIPLNRKSIVLYKQLGWIFYSKMGGTTDEMHLSYKRRWAGKMQRLLGAPPFGTAEETIDDFRPVVVAADGPVSADGSRDATRAFLDKTVQPTGEYGDPLQTHTFQKFLAHPDNARAAEYVAKLTGLLTTDEDRDEARRLDQIIGYRTLIAYNRFTGDPAVALTRREPPRPAGEREEALSKLINAEDYAKARGRLLALIRAHVLWNHYRMDPAWMLEMMKHFGPIDWRHAVSQALYWVSHGSYICHGTPLGQIDQRQAEGIKIDHLNTDRVVMNAMKDLTWYGRMTYLEDPENPNYPQIGLSSDWRFIQYTNDAYDRIIRAVIPAKGEQYKGNIFKDGHINFLAASINLLYAAYRHDDARELFEWTRTTYDLKKTKHWALELEDFVMAWLNQDGSPIPEVAVSQMTASLQAGFVFLASNKREQYNRCVRYAYMVHKKFNDVAPPRLKLVPFYLIADQILMVMFVNPRLAGYNLSLDARARVWAMLPDKTKQRIYRDVAPSLARECDVWDFGFKKSFPPPPPPDYPARPRRPIVDPDAPPPTGLE